jgi:hypothetical protein
MPSFKILFYGLICSLSMVSSIAIFNLCEGEQLGLKIKNKNPQVQCLDQPLRSLRSMNAKNTKMTTTKNQIELKLKA